MQVGNGHSLYLWESEVQRVQITDSQVSIVTASGKNLAIEFPTSWIQNQSMKREAIPRPIQLLTSPEIPSLPLQTSEVPRKSIEQYKPYDRDIQDLQSNIKKILEVQTIAQSELNKKLEAFRMQLIETDSRVQQLEAEMDDTSYLEETMRSEQGLEVLRKTYESLIPKVENETKPEKVKKKKK